MKKVLRTLLAIILIAWIVYAWLFVHNNNKMKAYSSYCMDSVRHELWEYIWNIHINDSFCSEWVCVYMWGVSYEWVDYSYSCKIYNKENVELDLEPLYPEEEIVVDEPVVDEEPIIEEIEVNEPEVNEPGIEEVSTDEDMPVAKMRVAEWQTEEEVQAMVEEACSNMWWTWTDGSCMLEDGSYINF